MCSHSISIVPRNSEIIQSKEKANEILEWLISIDVVKKSTSDCILGSDNGYAISEGAKRITNDIEYLPYNLITNGLEITTKRQIFNTGQGGLEKCICPNCGENIESDFWEFLDEWFENKSNDLKCSECGNGTEINKYQIEPQWGFSNIGFTFWNWPMFKEDFINEFREKLGVDIFIIHSKI
jgi:hypothetical protein